MNGTDEFGGVAVDEPQQDEFGGVLVEEAAPVAPIAIPPPLQQPRLQPGANLRAVLAQPPLSVLPPTEFQTPEQFGQARLPMPNLTALQRPEGTESQIESARDVPEPLLRLPTAPDISQEPRSLLEHFETAPTQQLFGEKAADVQAQITRSVYNAAKSVPEFLTTEEGMLSALAYLNPLGRAGVTAYFTYDMAKTLLDQAKELGGRWDELSTLDKAKAITQAATSLGFTGLLAKAGLSEVTKPFARKIAPIEPAPSKAAEPSPVPPEAPAAPERPITPPSPETPAVAASEAGIPIKEAVATETDPKAMAGALGVRYDHTFKGYHQFTMEHANGKWGTTFLVPEGSTLADAFAKYEDMRQRWEGDPNPPLPSKWSPESKVAEPTPVSEPASTTAKAETPAATATRTEQQVLIDVPTSPKARSQQIDTLRRYDAALERQESKAPDDTTIDQYNNWRDRRAALQTKLKELESSALKEAKELPPAAPTPAEGTKGLAKNIRAQLERGEKPGAEAGGGVPIGDLIHEFGRSIYEKGMKFADWSAKMIGELGEKAREWLQTVWTRITDLSNFEVRSGPESANKPYVPVKIRGIDGKIYDAQFNGYYDLREVGAGVTASIGREIAPGHWSHGGIREGERVLTQLPSIDKWQRLLKAEKTRAATPITLEREAGAGIPLSGVTEAVKKAGEYVKSLYNEELKAPKMNDRRRAVLNWSAKLQSSFVESAQKQREIVKAVPNPIRREGITNWIQADGDKTVLQDRANATTDKRLKAGYEAALNLTPNEIAIANQVKADYAAFASRGQAADVLDQLKDNYVTQSWDLGKGPGGTDTGRTLKEKFRFSKASTFANFFEGEQAGYKPKTKDISKLLPMYSHEMNSVIAAREMVADMGKGVASDGRPLLAPKGAGMPVENPVTGDKSTLVMPKATKEEVADYKVLPNHPALSGWRWVSKDTAGNPVFLKADLALHPEAFTHLKNILGRSAIRDWYGTRTTALAEIPKAIVKGIDMANSETKRTMLGLLATFHQIQTGTHAIGHRVNPFFSIPKIDLKNNPAQMDAAKHGLMLAPDRASMDQFMEGFRTSGLISKLPGIGPIADWYSGYLFHDYIPGLKAKTYDAILNRNRKVYAKELTSKTVTESDVKLLSAEQANAAYGHINYADLGRNPTIQHIAQLGLLAPDFLEARGRFAGQAIKGTTGAKVGREQLLALATLAIVQAGAAYTAAKLTGGEWDAKRPFEFVKGNRRYTVRSIPEDLQNLTTKTRQFIHSRLSPLIGKGTLQYLTGVDYRGRKIGALQTTKELAAQPLPLTIRGFTGLGSSTLSGMEQLAGSLGLRISRYSPTMDLHDIITDFKKSSPDPKIQAEIDIQEKEVFASVYEKLRAALHSQDLKAARKEYDKLREIRTAKQIDAAMKPWTGGNVNRETLGISPRKAKPFTGSAATERVFLQTLTPDQKAVYQKAVDERSRFYQTFRAMLSQQQQTDKFGGIPVE